jgi:CRP-like cAMP-binding protein
MRDDTLLRLGRELFVAALGLPLDQIESWAVDRLTALLEERSFGAGDVLYRADETADSFYFVQDGEIRMTREGKPPWVVRGRWAVGVLEAVLETPRTHTATAMRDFDAMRVPAGPWVELMEDSFQIARGAVLNAGRATALLEERIPELPIRPSSHRVPARGGPHPPDSPLPLVERLATLVDVRMLGAAGVQSLVDLAAATQESSHEAGATILARGEPRPDVLLVVEGEVLASREEPRVVRHYGPGEVVLGAASFVSTGPAWEARAALPTRVLSFPIEFWFDLMAEHFDLVRSTLAALSARRDALIEHLAGTTHELVLV